MTNDTDDHAQPALWGDHGTEEFATTTGRAADPPTRVPPLGVVGEPGELWTIDQVADYLGVSKQTIYCWRTTGYGPHGFRVGKHLRWRANTVLVWTADLERDQ